MFGTPSAEELKLQYGLEFGANSPKLRTTVAAYLIENGINPTTTDDFAGVAQIIIDYVAATQEAFGEDIARLVSAASPEQAEVGEVYVAPDVDGYDGQAYL